MGFFGRLFGGGARKPPSWARGAFGDDIASFDAFAQVIAEVLEARDLYISDGDLRTGSTMLGTREWFLEEPAYDCSRVERDKWREIVERSFGRPAAGDDDDDDYDGDRDSDDERDPAAGPQKRTNAWAIGCAAWGGMMFECGKTDSVMVVLPITDRAPFSELPALAAGLAKTTQLNVKRVIVCNGGDEGHLMGTAIARACGLAHVYAIDPSRPIDRGGDAGDAKAVEVRALETLHEGALQVERRGLAAFGTWRDGATFLCGDTMSFVDLVASTPAYVVGKLSNEGVGGEGLVDVFMKMARIIIPANVPGVDATRLAEAMSTMGVHATVMNGALSSDPSPTGSSGASPEASSGEPPGASPTESRRLRVLAHMTMGDLDAADALAVEAIAAGEEVADMHHQRAMIALMRGDEADADAHLANIDTPQSLTSRAIIAARRRDPAAKALAKRALERLPGDVIAIRAAIMVHALFDDRETARSILAEQSRHLDAELRVALDKSIDEPPRQFGHNFPEHAKLVFEAVKPMLDAGDYEQAEPLLRRAVGWDPENLELVGDLGFTLSKLQRDADAVAVYDAAIERGGSRVLLRFNRGNCQLRRQKYDQAVSDFRACVDLKADWHEARINLVSALFASGNLKGARGELAQLEKLGAPGHFIASLEQMLAGTL